MPRQPNRKRKSQKHHSNSAFQKRRQKPYEYDPLRPTTLLALPREIRDQIFEYVLHSAPQRRDHRKLDKVSDHLWTVTPETHHHGLRGTNRQLRAEFTAAIDRINVDGARYAFDLSIYREYMDHIMDDFSWVSFPSLQNKIARFEIVMTFKLNPDWGSKEEMIESKFDECVREGLKVLSWDLRRLISQMRHTLQQRSGDFTQGAYSSDSSIRVKELVIDIDVEIPLSTGKYNLRAAKLLSGRPCYEMMEDVIKVRVGNLFDFLYHITIHDLEQESNGRFRPHRRAEWSPRFDTVVFKLHGKPFRQGEDLVMSDECLPCKECRWWRQPLEEPRWVQAMDSLCWLRSEASLLQEFQRIKETQPERGDEYWEALRVSWAKMYEYRWLETPDSEY